jgi:hypothetical protein
MHKNALPVVSKLRKSLHKKEALAVRRTMFKRAPHGSAPAQISSKQ